MLTVGLADDQSAKDVRKEKQRQKKRSGKARGKASDISRQVELARSDKANRDKELNRMRQMELQKKARIAEIQQLIDKSKIDRTEGEIVFNFSHEGKIKSIRVTTEQRRQLARNQIAIVISGADQVELVPGAVAEKIAQRDPSRVIENSTGEPATSSEDDPYADYQIPDDLVW